MSDEEIRDEIITMLLAGHETTATSLAWVIYRLLQNPQVLSKARAEVESVTGEGQQASRPTGEQIAGLSYLDSEIPVRDRRQMGRIGRMVYLLLTAGVPILVGPAASPYNFLRSQIPGRSPA